MKYILWPDEYVKSLKDIRFDALKQKGIRGLIFDIDNTLCLYTEIPGEAEKKLFQQLEEMGLIPLILSNGRPERVDSICQLLHCEGEARVLKPFCFRFKTFLNKQNLKSSQCVFIGDQIFTDVLAAKIHHAYSILVEPISLDVDEKVTRWKRPLEKYILKKMLNH